MPEGGKASVLFVGAAVHHERHARRNLHALLGELGGEGAGRLALRHVRYHLYRAAKCQMGVCGDRPQGGWSKRHLYRTDAVWDVARPAMSIARARLVLVRGRRKGIRLCRLCHVAERPYHAGSLEARGGNTLDALAFQHIAHAPPELDLLRLHRVPAVRARVLLAVAGEARTEGGGRSE